MRRSNSVALIPTQRALLTHILNEFWPQENGLVPGLTCSATFTAISSQHAAWLIKTAQKSIFERNRATGHPEHGVAEDAIWTSGENVT